MTIVPCVIFIRFKCAEVKTLTFHKNSLHSLLTATKTPYSVNSFEKNSETFVVCIQTRPVTSCNVTISARRGNNTLNRGRMYQLRMCNTISARNNLRLPQRQQGPRDHIRKFCTYRNSL